MHKSSAECRAFCEKQHQLQQQKRKDALTASAGAKSVERQPSVLVSHITQSVVIPNHMSSHLQKPAPMKFVATVQILNEARPSLRTESVFVQQEQHVSLS